MKDNMNKNRIIIFIFNKNNLRLKYKQINIYQIKF